jgi:SHS2 domain-containing protein
VTPGKFVEIDHTADVGLDLEGESPAEVLEAAQRGLTCLLMADTSDLVSDTERVVVAIADDYPDLLKTWCEELYRLLEEESFVVLESRISAVDPKRCVGLVKGVSVSAGRLAEASELKAVTYHQLAFDRDVAAVNELWRARVIFDV